jgi:class 3 adenylate cyclase/tetratricopeptide (TPR) repeat protein
MRCARCGFESPAGFRYCGGCGTSLAEPVPSAEERKVVTALFCDVEGSTALAERLDPEEIRHLLGSYYGRARVEIERFGGTVEKFIGDAVVGLFGAPRSHEDDPERAVRSALAIRDAIAALNGDGEELGLHVRVGIATGEVVVALGARPVEGEAMAWGDSINVAARLQQSAPRDGVLADEPTWRATERAIEYAEPLDIVAKGKSRSIRAHPVVGPRARRGFDLSQGGAEPLVNRREELATLVEALYRVRLERSPELVVLVGEPGIGKSRLVFELFRAVEHGPALVNWRHGRCPPYGDGVALWALGEVVKGQAGILETDDAGTAGSKLSRAVEHLLGHGAEAARVEERLRPLVGLGGGTGGVAQADKDFPAWRRLVEALARERPLVVVLEDLHWADDALLDFVEHLMDWAGDCPLLVVGTARPELLDRRRGWEDRRRTTVLRLAPLEPDETAELVTAVAGQPVPEPLAAAIHTGAGGNALYAVEYVRVLADRGLLASASGAETEAPLGLPASLHGVIAARLDALGADDKTLLQEASVVGRVFWTGALAAAGGRSQRAIERGLRELERRGLVVRADQSSVAGEAEVRFRHALVRDVAYGGLPRARRAELHRRVAEWIETLAPGRAQDHAEMLAHHYLEALELSGRDSGLWAEVSDRARAALRTAGDRAQALNAFRAAARYYGEALRLWPADDPARPALLLELGRASFYAEETGAETLAEARDALVAAGDVGKAAEAESLLGVLAERRGEHDRMLAHVELAAELVEASEPSRSKAEVLLDLAGVLMVADASARAVRTARQALAIAEALDLPELQARALATMGNARCHHGDPGGRADLERAIAIAESIDSPVATYGYGSLADVLAAEGILDRCFELQTRARAQAERFGHASNIRWLRAERAAECYWCGRWDEAVGLVDELEREIAAGAPHFLEGWCLAVRGRIRLARGDVEGALADAHDGARAARQTNELQIVYPALAFLARALAETGRLDEAAATATELAALWDSRHDVFPPASWIADFSFALDALGRGHELLAAARRAGRRTRWLDAGVAFAAGDFVRAATAFAEIGSLPDEAVARERAGAALLEAGRLGEARAERERALAFYRRVAASARAHALEAAASGPGL